MTRAGRFYVAGEADGPALVLSEPLSFWGGIDVETGDIIAHAHPERGRNTRGRILLMPSGCGSSSSSSVLAEAIRRGTGPVGIVLARPDPILTVGCLVAQSLYGLLCPLVVCAIDGIASEDHVRIVRTAGEEAGVHVAVRPGAPETTGMTGQSRP